MTPPFVGRAAAEWFIAQIDSANHAAIIAELTRQVVTFYDLSPTSLVGTFDLMFFAEMMSEIIQDVIDILDGTDSLSFFSSHLNASEQDPMTWVPPGEFNVMKASNYIARLSDPRMQYALQTIQSCANAKQSALLPHLDAIGFMMAGFDDPESRALMRTPMPRAPAYPMDFLFLVMALEHTMRSGQPARNLIDAALG